MKTNLQQQITETYSKLRGVLSPFSEKQFDTVPFEGSWTAGQVCEHLIKGTSGLPELCGSNTTETDREPDAKIISISTIFLDFGLKMTAPDFLVPTETVHDKKEMLEAFHQIENEMRHIIETEDISRTCLNFEIPGFGQFTMYEWIGFALTHTQRHTRQLANIYSKLNS